MDRPNGRSSKQRKLSNQYSLLNDYEFSKFCDDNDFVPGNLQSIKIRPVERSPARSINLYLGPYDFVRCSLAKVLQVAEPILTKLVVCITEDKITSETLETYALKRMTEKVLKRDFTKEQISILQQNEDFDTLDLTLKIKCVEVFIDFNGKLTKNIDLKDNIKNILKIMKKTRNDLCHNREQYTQTQCSNLANDLNDVFGESFEILRNWELGMDIYEEKKKVEAAINEIMKGDISKEDFNYMCLQKVLNHVVEPALNTVVKLICYNKTEDKFSDFFTKNGMNGTNFKKVFFKEEKYILKSKSVNVKLDVTLCSKIINICKEWHDTLANDVRAKKDLSHIICNIRDIRNHISHNILSMSQEECNSDAHKLGIRLEELANFLYKKNMYKKLDVPVIDIEQIYIDIKSIMSSPYPGS